MYSKYQIIKILGNCFQNMSCFSLVKLIPVLIHLKYWYYHSPYLELPCLSHHLCRVLTYPIGTPFDHVLHRFPNFVLPHSTTQHQKYWIYQTICQAKPINFIIKLYADLNTWWVKHATHQKAASLRAACFLFKVRDTVNINSIFNTRYAEFSMKW